MPEVWLRFLLLPRPRSLLSVPATHVLFPAPPPRHHHHQPAGPRELTREPEGWAPSPPLRGPGLSLSAPLLSRGGRSKKQTVDTTMSCSSRLFVFKSHVGVSSP